MTGIRSAIMTVFVRGTPPEACGLIGRYLALPDLPAELRAVIDRLAGNESMEPFWKQLPPRLQGRAEDIIAWTVSAFIEAISLQPPAKVRQKERDDFLQAHAPITDPSLLVKYKVIVRKGYPLTYSMLAEQASMLSESLDELSSMGRQHWTEAWTGDPVLCFDKLRSIVKDIAGCCDRLDADARQLRAAKNLPQPPRKRGAHTAQHVYFSRILKALPDGIRATLSRCCGDLGTGRVRPARGGGRKHSSQTLTLATGTLSRKSGATFL